MKKRKRVESPFFSTNWEGRDEMDNLEKNEDENRQLSQEPSNDKNDYPNLGGNQNMNNYGYDPNMFQKDNSGLAIASLIIGIISICCCCAWYIGAFLGVIGLALGIVALKDGAKQKGIAIAGIVTSSVGLLLTLLFVVLVVVFSIVDTSGGAPDGSDIDTIRHGLGSIIKS